MRFGWKIELDDDGRPGVWIHNLSFDPQGRVYRLTQGRFVRWWRSQLGWRHYVGTHFFE